MGNGILNFFGRKFQAIVVVRAGSCGVGGGSVLETKGGEEVCTWDGVVVSGKFCSSWMVVGVGLMVCWARRRGQEKCPRAPHILEVQLLRKVGPGGGGSGGGSLSVGRPEVGFPVASVAGEGTRTGRPIGASEVADRLTAVGERKRVCVRVCVDSNVESRGKRGREGGRRRRSSSKRISRDALCSNVQRKEMKETMEPRTLLRKSLRGRRRPYQRLWPTSLRRRDRRRPGCAVGPLVLQMPGRPK